MKKNKETTICFVFSNLGLGGIQRKIIDLVNAYNRTKPKTQIHIILRKKESYDITSYITNPNVVIHTYQHRKEMKSPLGFCFYLWHLIYILHPTAICAFISPFGLPAIIGKYLFFWRPMRVVIGQDHMTSKALARLRYPMLQSIGINIVYPFADAIICPTHAIAQDLYTNFHIPRQILHTIHNWTTLPIQTHTKKQWDIVYIGRFTKQKNVLLLLKTIATMYQKTKKPVRVCLCGDGPEKSVYQSFIKKHHLSHMVVMKPPMFHIETIMRDSIIAVCPSVPNTEGFPLTILEAMACGAVVITSHFVGVKEIIRQGENGYIFDTPGKLDYYIQRCLHDKMVQKKIVKQAQKTLTLNPFWKNIQTYIQTISL